MYIISHNNENSNYYRVREGKARQEAADDIASTTTGLGS